eukprot:TRINITY_DN2493_c0_g1_i14.p2 TRINITY_DN2493_c0_g1~~TRINITY_DN2493_c0_g1_i14.p2  ORF type:complete len:109 (-),score=16.60 TRINITY_DN2493_c0_g1_i14:6-332(-)
MEVVRGGGVEVGVVLVQAEGGVVGGEGGLQVLYLAIIVLLSDFLIKFWRKEWGLRGDRGKKACLFISHFINFPQFRSLQFLQPRNLYESSWSFRKRMILSAPGASGGM